MKISEKIIQNSNLTCKARLLYCLMCKQDRFNAEELRKQMGCCKKVLERYLAELTKNNIIAKVKKGRNQNGCYTKARYFVIR